MAIKPAKAIIPMLTFDSLARQPAHFRNFTGLTVVEARELVTLLEPTWRERRSELIKTDRRRKVGGGRKLEVSEFHDRLLVFLIYAKLYPTYVFLEYLFGVDHSTIGRVIQEIEPLLSASIIINRHHKRIRTLKDLHEAIPDLSEVIIDATEQRVNRPQKKRARKKHHSGKRKDFTLKEQIVATKEKIILHVSDPVPGRVHDYKLFHQSGVPQWLSKKPRHHRASRSGLPGCEQRLPQGFDRSAHEAKPEQTDARPIGENP